MSLRQRRCIFVDWLLRAIASRVAAKDDDETVAGDGGDPRGLLLPAFVLSSVWLPSTSPAVRSYVVLLYERWADREAEKVMI